VLVVDDSAVARAVIGRLVDASEHWVVTHSVPTIAAAHAFLATDTVDVILLDIHLPGQDGLSALPGLIAAAPGARVVVVSSSEAAGVEAMTIGAAAAVTKPGPAVYTSMFAATLIDTLARLTGPEAQAPVVVPAPATRRPQPVSVAPVVIPVDKHAVDFDLVAIGASTGGIHALSGVLGALPAACRVPIIVTQHLPASFMPFFAAQVAVLAGRPCDVAVDRMRVRPGRIIVAPGDAHVHCVALSDGGTGIRLVRDPQPSGCMPSVDPMFSSLAAIHRDRLLAIVLSGMGRDGAIGAAAVHEEGGCVVVQDCATSVVWGMPGVVAAANDEAAVLAPEAIGRVIASGRRPR
jgi:two-component system chemotaxis response regulator CheB